MGAISVTFQLGLGQEKCMDLQCEIHLVQDLEAMEAIMVRYQV